MPSLTVTISLAAQAPDPLHLVCAICGLEFGNLALFGL